MNADKMEKSKIENLSLQRRSGQALSKVERIDNRKSTWLAPPSLLRPVIARPGGPRQSSAF